MEPERSVVSTPPKSLCCPICRDVFRDPVLTVDCAHTFCKTCIQKVKGNECPLCRKPLVRTNVVDNIAISSLINELFLRCKNLDQGCSEVTSLAGKDAHEALCSFAAITCNHQQNGCKWSGLRKKLKEHLSLCPFESLRDFITSTTLELDNMKSIISSQTRELKHLKSFLSNSNIHSPISQEESAKKDVQDHSTTTTTTSIQTQAQQITVEDSVYKLTKKRWNMDDIRCIYTLSGHTRGVTALELGNGTLYSGAHDCSIKVWDISGFSTDSQAGGFTSFPDVECKQTITGHKFSVWSLVRQDTLLYSSSSDGTIRVWDIADNHTCKSVLKGSRKVYCLDVKDNILFSGGTDRVVRVWDRTTNQVINELAGHQDCIWSIAHSNSHNLLFSASDDRTIRVYDMKSWTCIRSLKYDPGKILSLAVAEEEGKLCMGTQSCKVGVWDMNTWLLERELVGHVWEVWQMGIKDGYLFSGSFDHTIKIWDLESTDQNIDCVKTLEGHKGYVHALKFADDFVVSGSGDKTIKIWGVS